MSSPPQRELEAALATLTDGDDSQAARLIELVYAELRALASSYFRGHEAQTLQPTALVHEAFVKVSAKANAQFQDRAHFFAVCALAMRSILADHNRRRAAVCHGGDRSRVCLTGVGFSDRDEHHDALALDEALTELAKRSERQSRIVEYRFFAGMTVNDVAHVLGISRSTVEEHWRTARAWLAVRLGKGQTP